MHRTLLKLVISILFLICFFCANGQEIEELSYLNRPHYKITTSTASYLYDRQGGGFSSIKDWLGNEWIGFKPGQGKVPESAGADFRGLPNLVFRGEDDGAGHPGFDQCHSKLSGSHQITTSSLSGLWTWRWTFSTEGAHLEVIETDTSRNYWFLYEGTPGGRFEPEEQFWGNNVDKKRTDAPPIGSPETGNGLWNWAFFGHRNVATMLFVAHLTPDKHNDSFSYMGASAEGIGSDNGMVVFGFGRIGATPLMKGSNEFYIGFFGRGSDNNWEHLLKEHIEALSINKN